MKKENLDNGIKPDVSHQFILPNHIKEMFGGKTTCNECGNKPMTGEDGLCDKCRIFLIQLNKKYLAK